MNDWILNFTYKLEFVFRVLFTRAPMIVYCRHKGFKAGDVIYFGSELKATVRRIRK